MAQHITLPTLDPNETQHWFTRLTRAGQHLYMLLQRCREVSAAGVMRWQPRRLAALARDLTAEDITQAVAELIAADLVDVDEEAGELWLVQWIGDGLAARSPMVRVAVARAAQQMHSERLRDRIAATVRRLALENPGGWDHPDVARLLRTGAPAADDSNDDNRPAPGGAPMNPDPSGGTVTMTVPQEVPATRSPARSWGPFKGIKSKKVNQSAGAPQASKVLQRIPADYHPSPSLISWALRECPNIDPGPATQAFLAHHAATGQLWHDPDAAWKGWMCNAQRLRRERPARRPAAVRAATPTPVPPPAAERLAHLNRREDVAAAATRERWRTGWRELIGTPALA